jgi:hypothetical protein
MPSLDRPTRFYKYRHASGEAEHFLERTVLHNEIYFAAPRTFNDPLDCAAVFAKETGSEPAMTERQLRMDAEAMLADPNRNPRNESVRNSVQDEHARVVRSSTGIYCVSEVNDDILMWSHYADYPRRSGD